MADPFENISYGQFGDFRDESPETPWGSRHVYQPTGSKTRFELENNRGTVTARKLGAPDEILPGGRPAKAVAGFLGTWSGGTRSSERYGDSHREISEVAVKKGYQGKGLAGAMLKSSRDYHDRVGESLSHSASLSFGDDGLAAGPGRDGATFARRYPLPGDKDHTHLSQFKKLGVPDPISQAATTMLGGKL